MVKFLSRLCGGEERIVFDIALYNFLSRLCGGEGLLMFV